MTLFEPTRTASRSTDQPAAVERGSNVSGGLRKLAMMALIAGLAYLAIRRSRRESRPVERIRNRVAAAVETRGVRADGAIDRGQPASGGVGVPSSGSDGDSGSVEASVDETDRSGVESEVDAVRAARSQLDEQEPADDEPMVDDSADDEPLEDAETAVDEMDDADEYPTEPGTMDVDRDVVEEAVDDEAVGEENETDDESEE